MWTVGLSQTGNLLGLREEQVNAMAPAERERKIAAWQPNFTWLAHIMLSMGSGPPKSP